MVDYKQIAAPGRAPTTMSSSSNLVRLPDLPGLSWDDGRLLLESVVDYAIFLLDPEGRVATWNVGAEKINGYTAREIIGEHFSTLFPPEDVASGKPEHELRAAVELGRVEDEGWRVRKDGRRFWASVITTALRDQSGNLRGFGKVARDLTARRAAEESLLSSEERFHRLVDAVTDYAIYMLDADAHPRPLACRGLTHTRFGADRVRARSRSGSGVARRLQRPRRQAGGARCARGRGLEPRELQRTPLRTYLTRSGRKECRRMG